MELRFYDHADGITTIDAGYVKPGIAALHLIVQGGRAAFVDTGTAHSLPFVRSVLAAKGLTDGDVAYVIPTHVHLDHAGGAGAMMRAFPNARLVIHPRGAPHMIDPRKLISGTVGVYGEAEMQRLYGEIVPVPEERVIVAEDEFVIDFDGRPLRFLDTPGHARHHFCVIDIEHRAIFSGDTLGISYRVFDSPRGPFMFPTTTPVQFEPEPLHGSIDRLMEIDPRSVFLTHFGRITPTPALIEHMHQQIDDFVAMALAVAPGQDVVSQLERAIGNYLFRQAREHNSSLSDREIHDNLAMDVRLNAQGVAVWLQRRSQAAR